MASVATMHTLGAAAQRIRAVIANAVAATPCAIAFIVKVVQRIRGFVVLPHPRPIMLAHFGVPRIASRPLSVSHQASGLPRLSCRRSHRSSPSRSRRRSNFDSCPASVTPAAGAISTFDAPGCFSTASSTARVRTVRLKRAYPADRHVRTHRPDSGAGPRGLRGARSGRAVHPCVLVRSASKRNALGPAPLSSCRP